MKAADSISVQNDSGYDVKYEIVKGLIILTFKNLDDNRQDIIEHELIFNPNFKHCMYTKRNALHVYYSEDNYWVFDNPTDAFMHDFILFYCLNGFKMKKNCHMYNFNNKVVIEKIQKIVKILIEKKQEEINIPDVLINKIIEYYNVFK